MATTQPKIEPQTRWFDGEAQAELFLLNIGFEFYMSSYVRECNGGVYEASIECGHRFKVEIWETS